MEEFVINAGEELHLHLDIVIHCHSKMTFSDCDLQKVIKDYLLTCQEK